MQMLDNIPENEDLFDFNEINSEIENYKNLSFLKNRATDEIPVKTQLEEILEDEQYLKTRSLFLSMPRDENTGKVSIETPIERTNKYSFDKSWKTTDSVMNSNILKSPQTVSTYSDSCSNSSKSFSPVQSPTATKLILSDQEKESESSLRNISKVQSEYHFKENEEAFITQGAKNLDFTKETQSNP